MVSRAQLDRYLDDYLACERFNDYAPNGLQVAGREQINLLVTGVTASLALLEAAVAIGADAVLVHHGYFWKGEDPRIVGMKRDRLVLLMRHEVNLFAYHLPLDAHPSCGNNVQLGRHLNIEVEGALDGAEAGMVWHGRLPSSMPAQEWACHVSNRLGRSVTHVSGGARAIRTVGWCTGAGQRYIDAAADARLDAFITGEISEQTVHVARERGIHFIAAGHHATERYGVQALGEHLAQQFCTSVQFVDIDSPA